MSWSSLLPIFNLFFAGTLSGVELASHYALVIQPSLLGEADQVFSRSA